MKNLKIACFSDVHGRVGKLKLPPSDIAIFAGDCMTSGNDMVELRTFLAWYNKQPIPYKVMIAGNHDRFIESHPVEFREMLDRNYKNIIYLEESGVVIEGTKIYGIPHTRIFGNWAFNRSSKDLTEIFGRIPFDTNILVTHGPSYMFLDQVGNGPNLGEQELYERMMGLDEGYLGLHVFGHIHSGYGITTGWHGAKGIQVDPHIAINASICNEAYEPVNSPILYWYYY